MPFFKTPDKKTSLFDNKCASLLYEAVRSKLRLLRPCSLKHWAKAFAKLRKEVDDKSRVMKVLRWYCLHLGDKYIPVALSGEGFRSKFLQIELAMKRQDGDDVQVTPEASKITKELITRRTWPKESSKQLPQAVQVSLDNYTAFREALTRLRTSAKSSKLVPLANYLTHKLSPPVSFVTQWFLQVHDRIANWDQWNGKLASFAFRRDHPTFITEFAGHAGRYATDGAARWREILKETSNEG